MIPRNTLAFRLWVGDAITVFANGVLSGLGGGTFAGAGTGAAAVQTAGGMDAKGMTLALFAAGLAAVGNGLKRFVVWHDANPMPNPFRNPLDIQYSAKP